MLLIVLLLVFISFYVWYKFQRRKYADLDKLPGPRPHFFYGNSLEFGNNLIGKCLYFALFYIMYCFCIKHYYNVQLIFGVE